jgi:hypothetical protein
MWRRARARARGGFVPGVLRPLGAVISRGVAQNEGEGEYGSPGATNYEGHDLANGPGASTANETR